MNSVLHKKSNENYANRVGKLHVRRVAGNSFALQTSNVRIFCLPTQEGSLFLEVDDQKFYVSDVREPLHMQFEDGSIWGFMVGLPLFSFGSSVYRPSVVGGHAKVASPSRPYASHLIFRRTHHHRHLHHGDKEGALSGFTNRTHPTHLPPLGFLHHHRLCCVGENSVWFLDKRKHCFHREAVVNVCEIRHRPAASRPFDYYGFYRSHPQEEIRQTRPRYGAPLYCLSVNPHQKPFPIVYCMLAMVFTYPHPSLDDSIMLFLLYNDASGLERALRLFPFRTGVAAPDWVVLDERADSFGAAGVVAAG